MIDNTAKMIEKSIIEEIRFSGRILRKYSRTMPKTEAWYTLIEAHKQSWERTKKMITYYEEYLGYE